MSSNTAESRTVAIEVSPRLGRVSGLLIRPPNATSLYVMAHGAGAGMRHRFMDAAAEALAARGVATLRYQFPSMEAGRKRPDPPAVAQQTVRAAMTAAADLAPDLPLFAGGKSFGGRMTSAAAAERPLPGVLGLIFLGFPLHAAGRPSTDRAAHLERVTVPMLFLQGTRDALADNELIAAVTNALGARATMHPVDGADHSFTVRKSSGRSDQDVLAELTEAIKEWVLAVS
ncbi:MAG: alpha/beta hydrolase family protein [Longimicrobiales bacterium]